MKSIQKIIVSSLVLCMCFSALAQADSLSSKQKFVTIEKSDQGYTDFLSSIKLSGDARFYTIYRNMESQYGDQVTASKNLAFLAYPNAAGGNAAGKPLAEFRLTAKPSSESEVSIGYALAHVFTGEQGDSSRFVQIRNLINFGGKINTDYGLFSAEAGGGVLWTYLSPLTMSNVEYRPDNFDRLPWDWYTDSWAKYTDFYNASVNLGGENFGAVGLQGFKMAAEGLPGNFGLNVMYGRTNQSVDQTKIGANPPSSVLAGRFNKAFSAGVVGINYYKQDGFIDNVVTSEDGRDLREIITLDGKFDISGIKLYTELGIGRIKNPGYETDGYGNALILRGVIPESKFGLPINAQVYGISNDVVSNVSSSINSNPDAPNGGYGRDPDYATALFINPLQEVGQITNNRVGFSLNTGKKIGDFKIELGLGLSQEIENLHDIITLQHKANAFSRSRFNPWFQAAGPYQRIKNIFRRSYEFVSITDAENGLATDYRKGFSSLDLSVNYKTRILKKPTIFKLFQNVGSIQEGFVPAFTDKAFLRQWYGQAITFVKLSKKVSALAFYEQQWVLGNERTTLSSHNNKGMRQFGEGIGYGLDYDFSSFAGIYFRHRFMYNQDLNFVLDNFEGQELTLELKVFF